MLPGVIMPVPLTKFAVRVALVPASIADGLAMKLVMDGGGGGGGVDEEPEHPAKPTTPRLRTMAPTVGTKVCLKGFPV
jgi:hypothetical protein